MRTLRDIRISNLLSFGRRPDDDGLDQPGRVGLEALNVLIGPNASGKSNLLEVLSLLKSLPVDATEPIRKGGGITEWMGKAATGQGHPAEIDVRVSGVGRDLRHRVWLEADGPRPRFIDERLELLPSDQGNGRLVRILDRAYEHGTRIVGTDDAGRPRRKLLMTSSSSDQSLLTLRLDPDKAPQLEPLQSFYAGFRLYRDWDTGREGPLRSPQPADLPDDFLEPSGRNLPLILNAFQRRPSVSDALLRLLQRVHPAAVEIRTIVQGGTVQLFVRERGLEELIPARRLSDGTLRWLALLAVLLQPSPPPLIAIEEPELGLHPDVIEDLARLLVDTSHRTQVVATTHSDHLVNALSHRPDAVLVTERSDEGTAFRRLAAEQLGEWLERYRLGELWMRGDLGGTRW